MSEAIVVELRRIIQCRIVEITTRSGENGTGSFSRVVLNRTLHGFDYLKYMSVLKVLMEHVASGDHADLDGLAYDHRDELALSLDEADSSLASEIFKECILNVAFTNGWTFSQLRILPIKAPSVRGNWTINGSNKTFRSDRRRFAREELLEAGLPEDILFPLNTHILLFDKFSHIRTRNENLVSKMFEIGDANGVNLIIICNPGHLSPYTKRLLHLAKGHKIPVSVWTDLDSGGNAGSHLDLRLPS